MYDVIKKSHFSLNHAGRDKMQKELNRKYVNIPLQAINLFKSMCDECQLRRKGQRKGVVVRPILSSSFNSRGQVDLIDMQSMPDGNYKFIMNYQDHLTKFCVVESLTSKRAAEVAYKLLTNVFLVFGAPHILQSDNGREFTANIITELKQFWPELVIVHGKPRHPQSQGSVERSNGDIHDMLVSWMRDNNTTNWSTGIKFVQFQKNRRDHEGIKRSPYEAMFGCAPKVGLSTTPIPNEILDVLQREEDLQTHLNDRPQSTNNQAQSAQTDSTNDFPESTNTDVEYANTDSSNDIPVPMDCEHECISCHTVFQTNDQNIDICGLCSRTNQIHRERIASGNSLSKQADRMVSRSNQILRPINVGDNVTVPVPSVDRGRGDPRNILCVVTSFDPETEQYKLGTRSGLLTATYSRNQFMASSFHGLSESDIDLNVEISVREAARLQSIGNGQGFVKCSCKTGCSRKTCRCVKANVLCNSRCHNSNTCHNK